MPINNPATVTAIQKTGSYVGDDSANRAIPHSLGVIPRYVIIAASDGRVIIVNGTQAMPLNETTRAVTTPTSTNFYVGNAASYVQSANGVTVTYKWQAFI